MFTAQEQVYVGLQAAFDGIGTVTDGSKNLFYGGNGDLSAPSTWAVWLSSRRRDSSAKYEGLCIYKAYSVDGIQLKYSRVNKTTYQITLKGLAVETRNAGDQLFQFYREA